MFSGGIQVIVERRCGASSWCTKTITSSVPRTVTTAWRTRKFGAHSGRSPAM
jgi:hypothetical protein